jgi:hypothetical protein
MAVLVGLTALCLGTAHAWSAASAATAATSTFRKTTVGASSDNGIFANYKVVNSATLSVPGSITKLSVYAIPGVNSPTPQTLRAVIYSDSGGSPGAVLATGTEVTYRGSLKGFAGRRRWLEQASPTQRSGRLAHASSDAG